MLITLLSLLGVSGALGAGAILYPPFGALLLGAAKGIGKWLGGLDFYQLGCIALAILALVEFLGKQAEVRHSAKLQAQLTASANALATERASNAVLQAAIAKQNAAVKALAAESVRQQAAAARASQIAQERAGRAAATARGLDASSRSSERQAQPCAPSKALTDAWRS